MSFDWDTGDSVVLSEQRAVAVYRNERGDAVIRQKNPDGKDRLISVRPNYAVDLGSAILREAGEHRYRIVDVGFDENELIADGMHVPKATRDKFDTAAVIRGAPFDWNEEAVAIPRQTAIAVHLGKNFADVVIRQQGENGAPDTVIEVVRRNCLNLVAAILRESGEHRFKIMELPDDVIIGRDGNRMHIPKGIAAKLEAMENERLAEVLK
ncbi:hypothetical protein OZ411_01210 [Bradyrhizobium sp. Arg237L]|uniref:hypothetical protein n=1 Tax=Bradyrhizobium sp. Arg237L TaxID=3003352 RepID=UPI00249DFB9B|nr:hypothetical protein [Bradyrhizobium sp. Arg237L]MDI4231431.1 hypothetical protein [Bradyrhizobium sp. Arg237L]